ncbi:hypothetical protein JN757_00425 [Pseudomonas granadensis]|uniref:Uncharacterized protein n=1 Tax=Pseudomonas granadensis TaxID=1421430 RepID=A0ABX7GGN1_9PSED|nr:hypothetical protein [Pseudomonas granadensis]QRK84277.1 hypothetical protein JN757_00425 [Pseudomonas granadensis]
MLSNKHACALFLDCESPKNKNDIKLMALYLLAVVTLKVFKKNLIISEASYFYFFQELSCLPPRIESCAWRNVQGPVLTALGRGFAGVAEKAAMKSGHQGFPCNI